MSDKKEEINKENAETKQSQDKILDNKPLNESEQPVSVNVFANTNFNLAKILLWLVFVTCLLTVIPHLIASIRYYILYTDHERAWNPQPEPLLPVLVFNFTCYAVTYYLYSIRNHLLVKSKDEKE